MCIRDRFNLSQSHLGLRIFVCKEAPVHVFALRVASVVTRNDSIWIYHRKDPELEVLPQFVRQDLSLQQEVDQTVNYEARMGLSRMLAAQDHNCWLVRVLLLVGIGDLQQRQFDTAVAFADAGEFDELERF